MAWVDTLVDNTMVLVWVKLIKQGFHDFAHDGVPNLVVKKVSSQPI